MPNIEEDKSLEIISKKTLSLSSNLYNQFHHVQHLTQESEIVPAWIKPKSWSELRARKGTPTDLMQIESILELQQIWLKNSSDDYIITTKIRLMAMLMEVQYH